MKIEAVNFLAQCVVKYLALEHIEDRERFCKLAGEELQSVFPSLINTQGMSDEEVKTLLAEIEKIASVLSGITRDVLADQPQNNTARH